MPMTGGYQCQACQTWVGALTQHICPVMNPPKHPWEHPWGTAINWPAINYTGITSDEVRRIVREEIHQALLEYDGRARDREWKPPV